jgi:uncharacterized protein (DUF1810 family)
MPAPPASDPYDLERFVEAQDRHDTFDRALAELRQGHKTTHWMWFVFPQIAGLGRSPMARTYALASLAEARAYLAHPVLGPRLVQGAEVLAGLSDVSATTIFGELDAMKLRSSMTLFARAAPDRQIFNQVLGQYFDGQTDEQTDRLLMGER